MQRRGAPTTALAAAALVLGVCSAPAALDRDGGKDITITAPRAAADAPYVQSLKVNGRTSTKPWLPESFAREGGRLDYTLGTTANTAWGSNPADAPPSFRDGEQPIDHSQPFHLTVSPTSTTLAPGGSIDAAVRAKRLSDDKGSEEVDFDGGGYSCSRQALTAAGLTSGGTGTVDGLAFT